MHDTLSIILPARNEAANLPPLLARLAALWPTAEILVVDDGSTDATARIAREQGARVVSHPYSMGNGAAIKTGARHAAGDVLVFMDADGQHDPADIARLLAKLDEGYEMVVGARQADTHASLGRRLANHGYNRLASVMTGYRIADLTSGFRAVRARHFRKFLYLLPNGFSYPTTSTMAFFRAGFPVAYVPIRASQRSGKSHIRLLQDGARFFIIILKIGALFSPMRFFLPLSLAFLLTGVCYYGYTYATMGRFTNMSAVLLIYSLSLFLIGLVSEQISALHYKGVEDDQRRTRRDELRPMAAPRQHRPAGQDTPAESPVAGAPPSCGRREAARDEDGVMIQLRVVALDDENAGDLVGMDRNSGVDGRHVGRVHDAARGAPRADGTGNGPGG